MRTCEMEYCNNPATYWFRGNIWVCYKHNKELERVE